MTVFKVHYEIDNSRIIMPVIAETPDEASKIIRKRAPGAIVTKVKVDKSGNVSPRNRDPVRRAVKKGILPEFKIAPGHVNYGPLMRTINDDGTIAELPDYWDKWATEDLSNHH